MPRHGFHLQRGAVASSTSSELLHRWAHLLKQQSSRIIIVYRSPVKEKIYFRFPFSFAANKRKFAISVFHLQKASGSCFFPLVPFSGAETWRQGDGDMES
jgi:hypothetical protein